MYGMNTRGLPGMLAQTYQAVGECVHGAGTAELPALLELAPLLPGGEVEGVLWGRGRTVPSAVVKACRCSSG